MNAQNAIAYTHIIDGIGSHIGAPWLSEETFAIAREEADARGQTIDAVVKNALAQYRLQRLGMLSLTLTRDEE